VSNEFKDKMLLLLTQVDDVKATEAALQTERKRHQDQIAQSDSDLKRTEDDIAQCHENALALRRQMDDLKNAIFARPDEEVIVMDETNTPTDGEHASESERHKSWKDRQRHLRQVQ
jgi:erythromycin esterase-like protein